MLTKCKQMIQVHKQKGAIWNDKLHAYVMLDIKGRDTVICTLTTIYMHVSKFLYIVHTWNNA